MGSLRSGSEIEPARTSTCRGGDARLDAATSAGLRASLLVMGDDFETAGGTEGGDDLRLTMRETADFLKAKYEGRRAIVWREASDAGFVVEVSEVTYQQNDTGTMWMLSVWWAPVADLPWWIASHGMALPSPTFLWGLPGTDHPNAPRRHPDALRVDFSDGASTYLTLVEP